MANSDTASIRIPGLTLGGAIQVSNATVVTTVLGAVAISLIGMHFMGSMKKGEWKRKEWKRHSPRAIKNKVLSDVMSFAANIHTVADNLPQIRNVITTLDGRIRNQIQAYESGDITAQEFDASIRNLYPMVLTELGIPTNSIPNSVVNKLDASINRISNKILDGEIPAKVKFRMYKTHPGLAKLHELGRQRALEVGAPGMVAMHTNAGVYLKEDRGWRRDNFPGKGKAWGHDRDNPLFPGNVHSNSNYAGWQRADGYYGAWVRQ